MLPAILLAYVGPASGESCVHPQGAIPFGVLGDVNGSGAVNVADTMCAMLGVHALQSSQPLSSVTCFAAAWTRADLNCDGVVSIADVVAVVHLSLGLGVPEGLNPQADGCPGACARCAPEGGSSCFIEGECVPEGARTGEGSCLVCSPAFDLTAYTLENCQDYYFDEDGDGYGQDGNSQCACEPQEQYTALQGGDCDDTDAQVWQQCLAQPLGPIPPSVAWVGNDGLVNVMRWVDGGWVHWGASLSDPGGWAASPSLSLDADGHPVVAWRGNDGLTHVRRRAGGNWDELGAGLADGGGWVGPPSVLQAPSGDVLVGWAGNDGRVYVHRWHQGVWSPEGEPLGGAGSWAQQAHLAVDSEDNSLVAWTSNDGHVHIWRMNSGSWTALGTSLAGARPQLGVDDEDRPILLRTVGASAVVSRFVEGAWLAVGSPISDAAGGVGQCHLAVHTSGVPAVAWSGNDGLVKVMRWSGAGWEALGPGVADPGGWAGPPSLSFDVDGAPIVAWAGNDGLVYVRRWVDGGWVPLGTGILEPGGYPWARPPAVMALPWRSAVGRDPFF